MPGDFMRRSTNSDCAAVVASPHPNQGAARHVDRHARRSADSTQQDHRAEGVLRREAGHDPLAAPQAQQMLTQVRAEVVGTTRNKQVPWSNSSLLGEVYLAAN